MMRLGMSSLGGMLMNVDGEPVRFHLFLCYEGLDIVTSFRRDEHSWLILEPKSTSKETARETCSLRR